MEDRERECKTVYGSSRAYKFWRKGTFKFFDLTGWHHHIALTLIAVWFLVGETHRGQQLTPALTLPQVRYGLSILLMEVFCTLSIASISRHVQCQLRCNESARFYYHRTRNCIPPKKLRRDIQ